jgi:hypothetical protein
MRNLVDQKVYTNIDIGTPKKTVQLPLYFDSNDFFIGDNPIMPEDRFSDLKFYNSKSSTLEDTDPDGDEYYAMNGDMFEYGVYKKDNFYFNNQAYNLEFYFAQTYREVVSGGIGLQLYPSKDIYDSATTIKKTFLYKIKNKGLIKGYYWSIFYNSNVAKKEEEATLLLGCLPHEFEDNIGPYKKGCFIYENKKAINLVGSGKTKENKIDMDSLYAYEGSNSDKLIEDFPNDSPNYKRVELDYHSGGVKVPTFLQKYYHRVFEEHILSGNCFNTSFQGYDNNFYYCKKDDKVLSKIKSVFPKIVFLSRDLIYNFTLDYNDLFVEENGYVFCLLYFKTSLMEKDWKLGKPFLRKYLFVFNYDENYINFYENSCENSKKNEEPESKGISMTVLILAIIGTVIIVLIACFLIFKFYLYDKFFRKKRANELTDDDFEYTSKEENKLGV